MIRGLWFFAQLAAMVLAAVWLALQKGPVSIEWRGWLVETTVGFLILAVLIAAGIIILLWRLWRSIKGTPHAISRFRLRRRRSHGHAALVRSLWAIASEEGAVALRHASEAEEIGEPVMGHLAAAKAAELAGDNARAAAEYATLRDRPDAALIGLKGLIGVAEARGDLVQAIELARQARRISPKSPWAARCLLALEERSGAVAEAERTLADAVKLGAIQPDEGDRRLARILAARAIAAEASGNAAEALADAERAHGLDPAFPDAATLAARLLATSGRTPAAERVLARSWAAAADPSLAAAWIGLAPASDVTARLRQAERLHALDRDNPQARLALAEVHLAAGRWAEARGHLLALAEHTADPRYCALMAYLESASGNQEAARSWFEKSIVPTSEAQSRVEPDRSAVAA